MGRKSIITDRVIMAIMNIGYNKEMYVAELARALSSTFPYTLTELLPKLTAMGIVEHKKSCGKRMIKLTSRGEQIYKHLAEIGELLGEPINETDDRIDLF